MILNRRIHNSQMSKFNLDSFTELKEPDLDLEKEEGKYKKKREFYQ